jgi:hypothetical protein
MPTDEEFRIPAARDAKGRLVTPEAASRRAAYRCPACDGPVDLHAGEKKRRHFHHRAAACSAESVTHLTAKLFIADAVNEWLGGGRPVVFVRRCAHDGCDAQCRQAIPAKVGGVALEHMLPSGHVVDVALVSKLPGSSPLAALPVAAIEVHHTHAVDDEKAMEMGIPWIEVDARQACEAEGRELVVTTDRFLPWLCADHQGERGRAHRAARAERSSAAALAKKLSFSIKEFPGFRIAHVAACPNGHAALVFEWDGKDPPWPRPPLVVAVQKDFDWSFGRLKGRPTQTAAWRRAYASACATCGAIVDPQAPPSR